VNKTTSADDLELWKHHANFGGKDKNIMVSICTWLLGGSAAVLWYIWTNQLCPNSIVPKEPLRAFGVAMLGMGVSAAAGYVSLLYGGYANRNWEKADRIARKRGWYDLLPPDPDKEPRGVGLNGFAKRLARPCNPEVRLPLVFVWFFFAAVLLFFAHSCFFIMSAVIRWC